MKFPFKAKLWLYPGMAGWHFVTLPKMTGQEIKASVRKKEKGDQVSIMLQLV